MNIKEFLKYAFAVITAISLIVMISHWNMETESTGTVTTLLVLNSIALILSLPSSFFAAAAVGGAWYALDLDPRSGDGVFLNTILLSVIGSVQWFWLERLWYPKEAVFDSLDIA